MAIAFAAFLRTSLVHAAKIVLVYPTSLTKMPHRVTEVQPGYTLYVYIHTHNIRDYSNSMVY